MCGRFNVTSDPMTELFMDFVGQPFQGSTNYNTAPRQQAWIIRQEESDERSPAQAQWWLIPNWVKEESYKYSMFNATRLQAPVVSWCASTPNTPRKCRVAVAYQSRR